MQNAFRNLFGKRLILALAISAAAFLPAAGQPDRTANFRTVVETRQKTQHKSRLDKACPIDTDSVAERVFRDYGAMFVAGGGIILPSKCVFGSESEVQMFQATANPETRTIGGVAVTLQEPAMAALIEARAEAAKKGLTITPRGGAEASTRSFTDTVRLWRSRFEPGLAHWMGRGKIRSADAAAARRMPIHEQVAAVLDWESQRLYFSTDFSKSILYSVAAPGASQHIFMLALDVAQFANPAVRAILARHGWFQTVKSDLPHFTYLGVKESDLASLGLTPVTVSGQKFWIPNM